MGLEEQTQSMLLLIQLMIGMFVKLYDSQDSDLMDKNIPSDGHPKVLKVDFKLHTALTPCPTLFCLWETLVWKSDTVRLGFSGTESGAGSHCIELDGLHWSSSTPPPIIYLASLQVQTFLTQFLYLETSLKAVAKTLLI